MREAKHQIASFETTPNSRHEIDHRLAVKQYSRSSADQEMSLPKELRAEPVLRMTMMYLLHEIADLCDTSNVGVSDWFHFLWDRTRSIRKDIAQQELCCQGSVRLVEQCARFHIHCAGRLIAEEPQVFDQKINTENLTKCLQSLKYMYHDLRLKGEHCRNEPEFRAYIILLNLQDSNFLWEVKQLPLSIQQSAEVRFGIDVFKALEQNNYVRFFKLVRRTTYMNACILLRYFSQVRGRALATIVKAYSIKSGVPLSLSSLSYSLAFEDEQMATQFFVYYGLSCDEERVFVDRTTFYYPDLPYIMERAINVVEQKRCISVGAVIAGGEDDLAPKTIYSNHVPENSFDSRGFLKSADDVNLSVDDSEIVEEEEEVAELDQGYKEYGMEDEENGYEDGEYGQEDDYYGGEEEMEREDYDQDDMEEEDEEEDFTEDIHNDVVDSDSVFKKPSPVSSPFRPQSQTSARSPFNNHHQQQSPFKFQTEKVLPSLPSSGFSFAQPLASSANGTPTTKNTQITSSLRSPTKNLFNIQTPSTGGFSFVDTLTHPKNPESKLDKKQSEEQRLADIKSLAGPQSESMMKDVCADLIRSTAEEVLQDHLRIQGDCRKCGDSIIEEVVREMIQEIHREESLEYHVGVYARQKMLKRAFHGWRNRATITRQNRDRTQMAPLWMPTTGGIELESRHQQSTLTDLARYRLGQPTPLQLPQVRSEKIDIEKLIAKLLALNSPQHSQLLFHVVISIPGPQEGTFGCCAYLQRWFREHLNASEENDQPLIIREVALNAFQTVAICIRLVVGCECRQEDGNCLPRTDDHLDGIILYLSEDGNSQMNRRRLYNLLDKHRRREVPVAVLNMDTYQEEEKIMIKLGMDDDRIGSVLVDPKTERRLMRESLEEAISFLADHYSIPNSNLRSMELINLVTSALGESMWMRLSINSTVNAATDEILRHGHLVTEIYNEAVDRVVELCAGDYSECAEVPQELRRFISRNSLEVSNNYCHFPPQWRSSSRQRVVKRFLESLKVNKFPQVRINNESFEPVDTLLEYLIGMFISKDKAQNVIFQMVQGLRNHDKNWVKPMQILTRELFVEKWRQAQQGREQVPQVVVYDDNLFSKYQDTPWWLQSTVLKRRFEIEPDPEVTKHKRRRITPEPQLTMSGLDDILDRANKCVERAERITLNFKQNKHALDKISSKYDDRLSQLTMFQDTL